MKLKKNDQNRKESIKSDNIPNYILEKYRDYNWTIHFNNEIQRIKKENDNDEKLFEIYNDFKNIAEIASKIIILENKLPSYEKTIKSKKYWRYCWRSKI